MKRITSLILASVLMFSLAACTGNASAPSNTTAQSNTETPGNTTPENTAVPSETTPSTPASEATEEQAGTDNAESGLIEKATIGTAALNLSTLTPFRNTTAQHMPTIRYLFDRIAYPIGTEYIMQGAKSYEVAEDGVTWSLEIYDYITDSQGNHITASDVKWFIEKYMAEGQKPCFNGIASVEQTGDYTLTIVMKEDVVDQFQICMISTYLISQKAFESSADGFTTNLVSASPYVVTDFVPDSSVTFTLRDDYWQKPELIAPQLATNIKEFTILQIAEASQQQIALETGTVDSSGVNATIVGAFVDNDGYRVSTSASSIGYGLYFSGSDNSVLANDVNLRMAICYAIDGEGLITGAGNGYGELMHDITTRTSAGYSEKWQNEEYFSYNPELAMEYLAKSNYNGEELSLLSTSVSSRLCTMMQAYLEAVGITLKLDLRDSALYSASMYDGSSYDMVIVQAGNGVVNQWSNRFDMNAYANGDATSRKDETLTELLYFARMNANFNDENKDKLRQYVIDNAYAYGMYLPYSTAVTSGRLGMVSEVFNNQGVLDLPACTFSNNG